MPPLRSMKMVFLRLLPASSRDLPETRLLRRAIDVKRNEKIEVGLQTWLLPKYYIRVPRTEVGKKSSIAFFCFRVFLSLNSFF